MENWNESKKMKYYENENFFKLLQLYFLLSKKKLKCQYYLYQSTIRHRNQQLSNYYRVSNVEPKTSDGIRFLKNQISIFFLEF